MRRVLVTTGLLMVVIVGWAVSAPTMAQLTTVELRSGEILAVDGNIVTARGPAGVRQFVVPEDFRFDMDGQKLSVHQLKPGMKVTAMVTTTETPIEVTTNEVRDAEVVYVSAGTIIVKDLKTNENRQFTTAQLRDLDLVVYRAGERVDVTKLKKGDRLSATIVTKLPPMIVTDTELKAFVSSPPPPPRPVAKPAPAAESTPPPPPPPAAAPKKLPKTGSSLPLIGIVGVALLGLGIASTLVRRLLAQS